MYCLLKVTEMLGFLSLQGSDALSMNRAFAHMKLPKPGERQGDKCCTYKHRLGCVHRIKCCSIYICTLCAFSVDIDLLSLSYFVYTGVRSVCSVTV